jgi:hypothetical protein
MAAPESSERASSGGEMMRSSVPLAFTRMSFIKNGRVHVESCCERCNFRILEWRKDFRRQERRHEAECSGTQVE